MFRGACCDLKEKREEGEKGKGEPGFSSRNFACLKFVFVTHGDFSRIAYST